MVCNFQNGESFSPFLLISWDSVRFVQTLPLYEKVSPSCGIYRLKLLIDLIFTVYFENSPGILAIFKTVRVSSHFSLSPRIPRDWDIFSWRVSRVKKHESAQQIEFHPAFFAVGYR